MASQSALRRTKTSTAVVEYLHGQILEGKLRCGERIDVERISAALGVSPTPVREALVLLERDGVVSTRWHRAAFVEHFDARTLRADFHALGVLSGIAAARVALDGDEKVIAELRDLLEDLRRTRTNARRQEVVNAILRLQHQAGATPRLRAELAGWGRFLEFAAAQSDRRSRKEIVAAQEEVIDAIADGDSARASRARLADARAVAEEVIGDLIRRGVLRRDGTNAAVDAAG